MESGTRIMDIHCTVYDHLRLNLCVQNSIRVQYKINFSIGFLLA